MARNNWRQEQADRTREEWEEAIEEGSLYVIRQMEIAHAVQDGFRRRQIETFEIPCKVLRITHIKKTQCELVFINHIAQGTNSETFTLSDGRLKRKDYHKQFSYNPVRGVNEIEELLPAGKQLKAIEKFKAEQAAITAQMQKEKDEAAGITRFDGYSKNLRSLGYDHADYEEEAKKARQGLIKQLTEADTQEGAYPVQPEDYQKYASAAVILRRIIAAALARDPEQEAAIIQMELNRYLDMLVDDRDSRHDGLDKKGLALAVGRLRFIFTKASF